ncbi:MAG: hypothetical protein PHS96_08285 [Anaerolineales bacterium]|nr:hypothetical protein [Anaerolineales bacterium]
MTRKSMLFPMVAVLLSLLLSAALPGFSYSVRLTVKNRTERKVYIKMTGQKAFYYLRVRPGSTDYTIKTGEYKTVFWGCGRELKKTIDVEGQMQIGVTCNRFAHKGERKMIKVSLTRKLP